ncbi:MAG TPA: hypothetical protein VKB68_20690 [Stellaceae bacterium]|nr:hypothetical protein [Stellaceae bacterium]
MTRPFARLCALVLAVALQAGVAGFAFAQGSQPAEPGSTGGPEGTGAGAGRPQSGPPPQLPVLYITSVEVMRSALEPHQDIIRVHGVTGSKGWSSAELVPLFSGAGADGILDLQFIAVFPLTSQKATGFAPIDALFPIDIESPYKGVRIRAAANVLELMKLPGTAEVKITKEDCKDCIGKKFAEKGKAPAGTAGVVREEDLPRNFRVIMPDHGVAGITHNMNRLNLVIGQDKQTIVEAFWE